MPKVKLRPAVRKDEKFLRKIRNDNREFFLTTGIIDPDSHHKWFLKRLKKDFIYIICIGRWRVGTVSLVKKRSAASLERFVIREPFRSGGIGSRVIDEFKGICRGLGVRRVALKVKRDNWRAMSFYVREGFFVKREDIEKISMEARL